MPDATTSHASTAGRVFRWRDLPSDTIFDGRMRRAGFRSDDALLVFHWAKPGMKRWEPHAHPFDQIVLTVEGRQMLEIEGEAFEMTPGTIARVPANAKHTGWIVGDDPVMNIDIFAPTRGDYLFMVDYQTEYGDASRRAARDAPTYAQNPAQSEFNGTLMADTSRFLRRWRDLPTVDIDGGAMKRAGFRGDGCLLSFNWIAPGMQRAEPHQHPFDQVVLTVRGSQMLEIDGQEGECGPGTVVRVPANAPHTGWALGSEPILNIDVFAPARADYLFLTEHQSDFERA
jgi:quercetin dioxygenase-like cupin family protein